MKLCPNIWCREKWRSCHDRWFYRTWDNIVGGIEVIESQGPEVHVASLKSSSGLSMFLRINIQTRKGVIAANHSRNTVIIGANGLTYLSIDGLIDSIGIDTDAPNGGLFVAYVLMENIQRLLYDYEKRTLCGKFEKNILLSIKSSAKKGMKQMTNKECIRSIGRRRWSGYEVVERIKKHVARTERCRNISGAGLVFGGMFDLSKTGVKKSLFWSPGYEWCWYQVDAGY